jgi:D-tagatose-1,6-bisphosphate aldolase subunit GatZ/KbaZ
MRICVNYLDFMISSQKHGKVLGITSVCSAHPYVLEAALLHGLSSAPHQPVLIEATCNQVNQFGGYTGMRPVDFVDFIYGIADQVGFPRQDLILGADHLGPLVWSNEPAAKAMQKAKELVREYVCAGFGKIHLDCSMPCADDQQLPLEVIARRAAELAAVAESECAEGGPLIRYVIGSEVPPAGGAKTGEDPLAVTNPVSAAETIAVTRRAFSDHGLESAWERVIALVVQPGVEFGDEVVHEYDRAAAVGLSQFIETVPGLVYEAHSTDYQTRTALRSLVEDHFAILKVGPGLTFAFREAVFALAEMEEILVGRDRSCHIRDALDGVMVENPAYWQKHYAGTPEQQKFARLYSFSDRIRYYWKFERVQAALEQLWMNLGDRAFPLSLVSEYMPRQYEKVRRGEIQNRPSSLLLGKIRDVLNDYAFACGPDSDANFYTSE